MQYTKLYYKDEYLDTSNPIKQGLYSKPEDYLISTIDGNRNPIHAWYYYEAILQPTSTGLPTKDETSETTAL